MTGAVDTTVSNITIRYINEDRTWGIATGQLNGAAIKLAGALAHLADGDSARIVGRWDQHTKYGPQLKVLEAYPHQPTGEPAVRSFLQSIRHIKGSRVDQLIDLYGADHVFSVLDRDPTAALLKVNGLGPKTAPEAAADWKQRRPLRDLHVLLAPCRKPRLAQTLIDQWGPDACAQVRQNPYSLTVLHGVGLHSADKVAQQVGISPQSPARRRAVISHLLSEAEQRDGHAYLTLRDLQQRAARLRLEHPATFDNSDVQQMVAAGQLVSDDGRLLRPSTARKEQELATRLIALAATAPNRKLSNLPQTSTGTHHNIQLSELQWRAVAAALSRPLSVVTGGPGTGKTTLLSALVDHATGALGNDAIAICAPTGKAARRCREATGHQATTIHRLLGWAGNTPKHTEENPLPHAMVICDEASMLNYDVARHLLRAIEPGTHLILIGDRDQLEPVGVGTVLADIITSKLATVTILDRVIRQQQNSMIVAAAHAVNHGHYPPATAADAAVVLSAATDSPCPEHAVNRDFFIAATRPGSNTPHSHQAEKELLARTVVEWATERMPAHYGLDPTTDVLVLAPQRSAEFGLTALNTRIRAQLNPDGAIVGPAGGGGSVMITCGEHREPLRVGDKVLQTKNDYDTGVLNGEVLVVCDDDEDRKQIALSNGEETFTIPYSRCTTLAFGYAISVHKAQGSEAPLVVMPVHTAHSITLSRNLLYTAITRASVACALVGQPQAIRAAIANAQGAVRQTRLHELLAAKK